MRRGKHRALVVWEGGKGYQLLTMSCSKSTTNELRCEAGVGDGSKRRNCHESKSQHNRQALLLAHCPARTKSSKLFT